MSSWALAKGLFLKDLIDVGIVIGAIAAVIVVAITWAVFDHWRSGHRAQAKRGRR